MSRLTDLIEAVKKESPNLGEDLASEIKSLMNRRSFGLVFESHRPEAVELPGLQVDVGSKVQILPPRGSTAKQDNRLWQVESLAGGTAHLIEPAASDPQAREVPVEDLVAVAEFRDPIFPGLVETGRVERGGDKPYHSVINAENYHALEMLTYTHRHSIDAIYIDPPYNTGAKDWKYNNHYVAEDDDYRHSKWLAMLERRLLLAKELLKPEESVLIVTIDEREYLRLGLLLEQTFPDARMEMITSVMSAKGVYRSGQFMRVQEYIYILQFGDSEASGWFTDMLNGDFASEGKVPVFKDEKIEWLGLRRREPSAIRGARPNQFYPIYVDPDTGKIISIGDPVDEEYDVSRHVVPDDSICVWPQRGDGRYGIWGITANQARANLAKGYLRCNLRRRKATPYYLTTGTIADIESGKVIITGHDDQGAVVGYYPASSPSFAPRQVWNMKSHNAETFGTLVVSALIPGRRFPFPKSIYAVEDALRFFLRNKPQATVLDFFAGSGTTAHAVMRLNKQDGGERRSINVTNNEVSFKEQLKLRRRGLRPGDPEWESLGICEFVTKPRITAAITGKTPEGEPVNGNYKFVDEFPMSDGFKENAVFYTLTYESALRVRYDLAFERIAPMLWLRAGARGRVIERVGEPGFEIADTYAVVKRPDRVRDFVDSLGDAAGIRIVYVVTDDSSVFQAVAQDLPEHVEAVQLYSSYLRNFEINRGRA